MTKATPSAIQTAIQAAGYVRDPNSSVRWYAGGPGIAEPADSADVEVYEDRIRVCRRIFFGEAYSKRSFWDTQTIAVFDNVEAFLEWCPTISNPGLPAYLHGD